MTWSLVGVGAIGTVAATTSPLSLAMPAGAQAGDLIVAYIVSRGAVAFTKPAAWTNGASVTTGGNTTNESTASVVSARMDYMIRGGSDPSGTDLQWTRSTTGAAKARGRILVYRSTVKPVIFDQIATTTLASASTTVSRAGFTLPDPGQLVVMGCGGARDGAISAQTNATSPPTWTEDASDSVDAVSPTLNHAVASATFTNAVATGNFQYTHAESARHNITVGAWKGGYRLSCDAGSFAHTGQAATLNYVHGGANANFTHAGFQSTPVGNDWTIEDVDFGAEAADRQIWVFLQAIQIEEDIPNEIEASEVTGVTIGGVAATEVNRLILGSGTQFTGAWWWVELPTGTSGDIVVTFSAPTGGGLVSSLTYRVVGASSTGQPYDNDEAGDVDNDATVTIDIPAGGVGLAGNFGQAGGTAVSTWTGLSEDYDTAISGIYVHSAASLYSAAGATALSITNTDTGTGVIPIKLLAAVSLSPAGEGPDPLTADHGVYTLTGQAVTFDKGFPALHATYAYTGQAVDLNRAYRLVAANSTYAYTGQVATLRLFRNLLAAHGTYTLAGQATTRTVVMPANVGLYTYTGQATNLLRDLIFTADAGSYTLTGQDADFISGFPILGDAGAFVLSGQSVNLIRSLRATFDEGAFSHTGQDASFTVNLPAVHVTYSFSGQQVSFSKDSILAAGVGSYTVSGTAILSLTRRLLAAHGSISLSGQAVALTSDFSLQASESQYSLNGQAATITKHYTLSADGGTFVDSGQAVAILVARVVSANTGAFTLTGQQALFELDLTDPVLVGSEGLFAVSGQQANLPRALRLSADSGTFTLSGQASAPKRQLLTLFEAGLVAATGQAASVLKAYLMVAETGSYTHSGSVQLPVGRRISAAPGSFVPTGQDVGFAKLSVLNALAGAFTLTGPPVTLELISLHEFVPDAGVFVAAISGVSFKQVETRDVALTTRPIGDTVVEIRLTERPIGDTIVEV